MADEQARTSPSPVNENARTEEEGNARFPVTGNASNEEETALVAVNEYDTAGEETARASDEGGEEVDSDLEDGDQVITRGYPRNHKDLERHGFRPVWAGSYPYSEIPEDIKEWLDEDGSRDSRDDLVMEIDSPAYTIQDEVVLVPDGVSLTWPVGRFIDEGVVSDRTISRICDNLLNPTPMDPWSPGIPQDGSPAGVSDKPALFPLRSITGACRLQRPSGQLMCMKVKSQNKELVENNIRRQAGRHLDYRNLWFRALSVAALKSTLAFFIPQLSRMNEDNELGPGFYTTNRLQYSLDFIGRGAGAIMVFKDPDLFHSSVCDLTDYAEWNAWIARWTSLRHPIADSEAPPEYTRADFVKGAISHRGGGNGPTQSDKTQLVAVSYKGCQKLASSLFMIIFVDTG